MAQTLQILEDPDFRIIEEGKFCFVNGVEARSRYPGDTLRIAAQVNNQIVMLDRLESPGAREVSAIQKLGMVSDE
eukprot:s14425_g1.t1